MGTALLNDLSALSGTAPGVAETALPYSDADAERSASALRRQAAERIALHRSRRARPDVAAGVAPPPARNTRAAKIASRVAERYAQTQSYRDFLAAEADRALTQARAAAELAARNAQAFADAQQDLLDQILEETIPVDAPQAQGESQQLAPGAQMERDAAPLLWQEADSSSDADTHASDTRRFHPPQTRTRRPRRTPAAPASTPEAAPPAPEDLAHTLADGITIRLYQDETGATRVSLGPPLASPIATQQRSHLHAASHSNEETLLLDEEIAFRHEPVFEESAGRAEPLPANLIEFPRQLVASRKARPRRAEGPLLEDVPDAPGTGQLRIFEVDPTQIAVTPPAPLDTESANPAQWTSIWLDARPSSTAIPTPSPTDEAVAAIPTARSSHELPSIASVRRRLFATAINTAVLGTAFAALITVFLWTAAHAAGHAAPPNLTHGKAAILSALPFAACAYALLAAIYQALFFTLSTATPGMRIARIALCTFADENPARRALRRRLPALLLSTLPLCLGFLWAALDEERLAWHDRICGIYQRSY